jgi:hypothetical protein
MASSESTFPASVGTAAADKAMPSPPVNTGISVDMREIRPRAVLWQFILFTPRIGNNCR